MADAMSIAGDVLHIIEGFFLWFLQYLPQSRGSYQFIASSLAAAWGHPEAAGGIEMVIVVAAGISIWYAVGNFAKGVWKIAAVFGVLVGVALIAYIVGIR